MAYGIVQGQRKYEHYTQRETKMALMTQLIYTRYQFRLLRDSRARWPESGYQITTLQMCREPRLASERLRRASSKRRVMESQYRVGARYFLFCKMARPALGPTQFLIDTGVLSRGLSGRGVKFTTRHQVPRLRMSGAIHLLPLYACLYGVDRDTFTFCLLEGRMADF